MPETNIKRNFFFRIVLPTLLVFILFSISIFTFIIPSFEDNMLDGKREMIAELTNSAWSILDEEYEKSKGDEYSVEQVKLRAVEQIKNLRYGEENKDYFWITDEYPNMIMHPYRPELDNRDLSTYTDPNGKRLFVECVKAVKENGKGYVDYMWQWKDDSTRIVPKLSFVREFKPWGWIIGTGIYIEDVKDEIGKLTEKIIYFSLAILFIIGVILYYIGRQSFRIEKERQSAENGLKESENKYKALVEASTDGLVMILNNEIVYANNSFLDMLGYKSVDPNENLKTLILRTNFENVSGIKYFNELVESGNWLKQTEAKLVTNEDKTIDVILFTSQISFGDRSGFTVIIKDISSSKRISEELGENKERFHSLINNINIGVFRITLGKYGKFIEANHPAIKIFGYEEFLELREVKFLELFQIEEEQEHFFRKIFADGVVKNEVLQIRKKDGTNTIVSVSAMLVKDDSGNDKYCDGIVEDITERIRIDEEKENLLVELQTSLKFLHQPVENFLTQSLSCNMKSAIQDVAKLITRKKYSAALIQADGGEYIGIVTDHDLRKRVIAENTDLSSSIYNVMSSPLITISHSAFVFEALMKMYENSTRHLAVKDGEDNVIGIISSEELLSVNRQSSAYLLREINIAENIYELSQVKEKLPRLIKTLVDSGAKPKNITKIITSIFDAIVNKLINSAIEDIGEPPVKFSFVALGSAGRKEQTLISDQDNAIIFENIEDDKIKEVKAYFDNLAKIVCEGLKKCGYEYCIGQAMANNPKWTQPLDVWKEYFHHWIAYSTQQDLIDISIYFDFRHIYGQSELADDLRKSVEKFTDGQSGFFLHLTKNCLLHKPPVGITGKILLESKGAKADTFDIKMTTMPISDFARIYSLKHDIHETNTLDRLEILFKKGIITKNSYDEIVQAYNFLMQLRFRHQATQLSKGFNFDNYIKPSELTQIEMKTLKNTFSQILGVQKRLSYDFSGDAL